MIVPDGIEPVEEWRTWHFDGTHLLSITNAQVWQPGEALHAECRGGHVTDYQWGFIRYGWTLERAQAHSTAHNKHQYDMACMTVSPWGPSQNPCYIPVPSVEPPQGYGYTLSRRTHETPREDCSCGIYAAKSIDACPSGDVFGKVKLWGKIIPGERGSRAEYAYPSELHVPPALADDPAILAYGVPVVVTDSDKVNGGKAGFANYLLTGSTSGLSAGMAAASQNFSAWSAGWSVGVKRPWYVRYRDRVSWASIGLNLSACALNLLVAFKVVKL